MEKLTYGQKAAGLRDNNSDFDVHEDIEKSKTLIASAIDGMNDLRNNSQSGEQIALCTIAIRSLQRAQMDMAKAISWRD